MQIQFAKVKTLLESKKNELVKLEDEYNTNKSYKMDRDWTKEKFQWDEKILNILKTTFHLNEFRLLQKAAINVTLSKQDLLLVMPTGGGKSLVYQLPSLYNKGITIVVSPLISLMEDQIMNLSKFNIVAYCMNSNTSGESKKYVYNYMNNNQGQINLVYVTPEWLKNSKKFMSAMQTCYNDKRIARFAIGMLI